jgi:hypothetical protein
LFPNSCAAAAAVTTISETIPDELLRAFATEAEKKGREKIFFFLFPPSVTISLRESFFFCLSALPQWRV